MGLFLKELLVFKKTKQKAHPQKERKLRGMYVIFSDNVEIVRKEICWKTSLPFQDFTSHQTLLTSSFPDVLGSLGF